MTNEDADEKMKENLSKSVWLLQWLQNRIKKNRNVIALFIGDTGSGKSLASIRLAELVDPNFNINRIVFTVKDFLSLVNSGLPPGSVIVFDDAGLGINARLWQEASSRIFGMLTQGFRYKQIMTFITVPDETFIERQSRKLVHIRFEATDVQGLMKQKLLSRNTFDPEHPMAKYPIVNRGLASITVKMVKFKLPDAELKEAYELKKKIYMEGRFKTFQEELDQIEKGMVPRKDGLQSIRVKCDECGYEWDFSGRKAKAQCPNCNHRIYVADIKEKEEKSGKLLKCRHCGYKWTYTGGANQTVCPNCEKYVSPIKDLVETEFKEDPTDPMNTKIWDGMTKEDVFNLMVSKMIKKGVKITPELRNTLDIIADETVKKTKEETEGKDNKQKKRTNNKGKGGRSHV